jgi:hypothetical protein
VTRPSKADREAAVLIVHATTNRSDHNVPGYVWSWLDTGMGHGLQHEAKVIHDIRKRTYRLALCEVLEMFGGDGHRFVHGDGKALPVAAVAAELRKLVRL